MSHPSPAFYLSPLAPFIHPNHNLCPPAMFLAQADPDLSSLTTLFLPPTPCPPMAVSFPDCPDDASILPPLPNDSPPSSSALPNAHTRLLTCTDNPLIVTRHKSSDPICRSRPLSKCIDDPAPHRPHGRPNPPGVSAASSAPYPYIPGTANFASCLAPRRSVASNPLGG